MTEEEHLKIRQNYKDGRHNFLMTIEKMACIFKSPSQAYDFNTCVI